MEIDFEALTDEGTLAVFIFTHAFNDAEVVESIRIALEALPEGIALPEAQCGAVSAIMGLVYLNKARDIDPAQHGPLAYLYGQAFDNLQHAIEHGNALAMSLAEVCDTPEDVRRLATDWVMDRVTFPEFEPADIFAV